MPGRDVDRLFTWRKQNARSHFALDEFHNGDEGRCPFDEKAIEIP
jgi:hypothetical protein